MALTAREIEILEWNIAKLNVLIENMEHYKLSSKKIEKTIIKRDRYQAQLDQG
jgi:hypothetical protein